LVVEKVREIKNERDILSREASEYPLLLE